MDVLITVLMGGLVSGVTQMMKKLLPSLNPLFWVACISVVAGSLYAIIFPMLPEEVIERIVFAFSCAVGIYEVLSSFVKSEKV